MQIDLIVRGACCLRPGVPGVSENIRVRSIVGRFLEHSRIFCFHALGAEITYCSSADWMTRNLARRVEVSYPIEDAVLKQRAMREGLETYLADDAQAWLMGSDGKYELVRPVAAPRAAQKLLLEQLTATDDLERKSDGSEPPREDRTTPSEGTRFPPVGRDTAEEIHSDFVERIRRKDADAPAPVKADGKSKKSR